MDYSIKRNLHTDFSVFEGNKPTPTVLWNIERIANSTVLFTGKEDGIIAEIGDN